MAQLSTRLHNCLACNSYQHSHVLDLGVQPLANFYKKTPKDGSFLFPLTVNVCSNCSHAQLSHAVDPDLLYKDYKYVSGTTDTLKEHFTGLVKEAMRCKGYPCNVLDIGCNDGTLLEKFRSHSVGGDFIKVFGVDPAENLRKITAAKKIPVLVDYWNSKTALKLDRDFSIITALNCLAHNANPYDFLEGCKRVLAGHGRMFIEFPYLGETLERNDLGQFYFEHHSYFTLHSFMTLIDRVGFIVHEFKMFPNLHGGTVRLEIGKATITPHAVAFRNAVAQELENPIIQRFKAFNFRLIQQTKALKSTLDSLKDKKIIAYGASAKSCTLFNYAKISDKIAYIVDDNPLKQGLYAPGSNLPIKSPADLLGEDLDNVVILLTVHNFKDEVVKRLKDMLSHFTLLNITPKVKLEEF